MLTKRLYVLVYGLMQIWSVVSSLPIVNDRGFIAVMWKVDVENSDLSIVLYRQVDYQFVPENALVIWKGDEVEEIDSKRYLHYWLGERVPPKTAALTAHLAMQMALKHCRGSPIIYRETQGYESEVFRSYFADVLWIDHKDADLSNGRKLFYVKGKNRARIKQVPIEGNWLEAGGSLVLDTKDDIFVHHGTMQKPNEVAMANKLAHILSAGPTAQKSIHQFDQGRPPTNPKSFRKFLHHLNVSKQKYDVSVIKTAHNDADEEDYGKIRDAEISLVVVYTSNREGQEPTLTVENIKLNRPFTMGILFSSFCMVFDSASEGGIFIWVGESSSSKSRIRAARAAEETIDQNNYPFRTPVTVVEEGVEPLEFKINFVDGLPDD